MPGIELIGKRQQNSKTFDLGNRRRQLVVSIGDIHYKENYADPSETWKDIDLTWEGNRITKAPYELTLEGKKLTLKDKKTGEVSTLELLDAKPIGLKFEIIPFNEGVSFQHTLPSDKVPFEAQFRVTGNFRTRAFDDAGELELETSFIDGILIEKLSQVKDKETGQVRAAVGNIRIDPTVLTVQPSGKDAFLSENNPDIPYGDATILQVLDWGPGYIHRSILEFDISELPGGATLNSAGLLLYYYEWGGNDPVGLTTWAYKQTHTDWVELEATWNIYKTGSSWTAAGGDYVTSNPVGGSTTFPAGYGWMTWNVLAIVQDAYDGSIAAEFLVKYADEDKAVGDRAQVFFYSNDYVGDTSKCPKLVIDYTVVIEQAVGGGSIGIAGSLNRKTSKGVGAGSIAIAGALGRIIKTTVGGGAVGIAGTLVGGLKYFINVGGGAVSIAGSLGLKIKIGVGSGAVAIAGTLGRFIKVTVGGGAVGIVGTLGLKIKLAVGAGTVGIAGTLSSIKRFIQAVGSGSVGIAGSLERLIKIGVGSGAVAIASTLGRKIFLAVGDGAVGIAGSLASVLTHFVNVGGGAITMSGTLGRKIFVGVGGGAVAIAGTLVAIKRFLQAVGGGSVSIAGALGRKIALSVGDGAVTIAGSLGRTIKVAVGNGAVSIASLLHWTWLKKKLRLSPYAYSPRKEEEGEQ